MITYVFLWSYLACCFTSAIFFDYVIKRLSLSPQVDWSKYVVVVALGPMTVVYLLVRWCLLKYEVWKRQKQIMNEIMTELRKEIKRRGIEIE
jgi:hypothetical protein